MQRESPRLLAVGETMALVTTHGRRAARRRDELPSGCRWRRVERRRPRRGTRRVRRPGSAASATTPLGRRICGSSSERGIDVSSVVIDPLHPTGLYVKDPGHAGVDYYRSTSAASHLSPGRCRPVPLDDVDILHVSGITAAISIERPRLPRRAHRAATIRWGHRQLRRQPPFRAVGSPATQPTVLDGLTRRADLVFVGRDEAETALGNPDSRPTCVRGSRTRPNWS